MPSPVLREMKQPQPAEAGIPGGKSSYIASMDSKAVENKKPAQEEKAVQKTSTKKPAATSATVEEAVVDAVKVDTSKLSKEQIAAIPTANPIMFQGIVSLALIVVLLAMIGACIFLGYRMFASKERQNSDSIYSSQEIAKEIQATSYATEDVNPFEYNTGASLICNQFKITGPVVFCIDAGTSMGDKYCLARDMVRASVLSMKSSENFAVIVNQDGGTNVITPMTAGGPEGEAKIRQKLMEQADDGTVVLGGAPMLEEAILSASEFKPKTIVLLIADKDIDSPKRLIADLQKSGADLVIISLDAKPGQDTMIKELAKNAGQNTQLKLYNVEELEKSYEKCNLPAD